MLVSILIFLLVLSVLVLVHEFGHFWVARKNGILVEEFGFGLPPRVFGIRRGETLYSINLLPFGGFVRLHGEQEENGILYPKAAFVNKSKRVRISVIVAGVIMNFLLAVVSFAIVYSFQGIPRDLGKVKIVDVSAGTPAQVAGLIVGDFIKSADKKEFTKVEDFINYVDTKKSQKVALVIEREISGTKSDIKLTITPRENPPAGEGPLGVTITTSEVYFAPIWQRPFYGMYYGTKDSLGWIGKIWQGLSGIAKDASHGVAPKDVAGPVGIFALIYEILKTGDILVLINIIGILSINLVVLNILPFPALDGGRLLFILIEGVIGRKVLPKVEGAIHAAGMAILLILIVLITFSDVRKLISAGSISAFLQNLGK